MRLLFYPPSGVAPPPGILYDRKNDTGGAEMIDKRDVIAFFDKCAAAWDAEMIRHEPVIQAILDNAGVGDGTRVLDVACGTGVLFPDYLARGASVTGIDISPEMARIAAAKFIGEPRVQVLCGDVEETVFPETFDVVMVYNAFPHFPDPARLMARLASLVRPGGRLSVAHGMSRAAIDSHHNGAAHPVSNGLMHEDALRALLTPYCDVDICISDERMYQVAGTKR